jgi:hypothetical protein
VSSTIIQKKDGIPIAQLANSYTLVHWVQTKDVLPPEGAYLCCCMRGPTLIIRVPDQINPRDIFLAIKFV